MSLSPILFDVAELSMRILSHKPTVEVLVETVQILESRYPEIIRRIFFINVSRPFTFVYNVILKPFIHPATADKIRMFTSNQDEWMAALREEIDCDQLPAFFGGTMTDEDGDPKCPSKFNMGGPVPKSYYLTTSAPFPKKYMETLNVIAGGKKKLKFKVDDVNSILRWEFLSEGGDISYRVYCKNSAEGLIDLVPLDRVDSHLMIEEGQITCSIPGKYVIEFDNSFSYLRSKKVRFFAAIEESATVNF